MFKLINIYQFNFKVFWSIKYFIERAKLLIFGWMLLMWNYTAQIRIIFNALIIKVYDLLVIDKIRFKKKSYLRKTEFLTKKVKLFNLQ